jgi:hypothetical protein
VAGRLHAPEPPGEPWYRQPLVWLLILIPAAAVIGGFVMLYLAISTDDGLVVDDYYRQGKAINQVLLRDRRAAKLGLAARVFILPETSSIRLQLTAANTAALPDTLQLHVLHATRRGEDQICRLARSAPGEYTCPLSLPSPAPWHLQLEGDDWRLTGRFETPVNQPVDLVPATP